MKPKNFPRRKLRRQLIAQGKPVPTEIEALNDIRIRAKAGDRRKPGHYTGTRTPKR